MKSRHDSPCPACRGTGWIVKGQEPEEAVAPCPDCRSNAKSERLLRKAGIPPRYFDRGFDVYSARQGSCQEQALKRAVQYVEDYPKVARGLLFVGPCGVGKTHLSVAILKALILEKKVPGSFVDETELLRRLQYSFSENSPETEREVLRPLMTVELLVWDDLGTGRPTPWVAETIRTVINYRYTHGKQTILSTNWSLKTDSRSPATTSLAREQALTERIGVRLLSRILEMCEIVEVNGVDFRIHIQKAGMDFEQSRRRSDQLVVPTGSLACPKCSSSQVEDRGTSAPKGSGAGNFVEVFCHCRQCSADFIARFFPAKGHFEYPQRLQQ
jgi:DNA replication protein DnaC